jgi:hypothetical protein
VEGEPGKYVPVKTLITWSYRGAQLPFFQTVFGGNQVRRFRRLRRRKVVHPRSARLESMIDTGSGMDEPFNCRWGIVADAPVTAEGACVPDARISVWLVSATTVSNTRGSNAVMKRFITETVSSGYTQATGEPNEIME